MLKLRTQLKSLKVAAPRLERRVQVERRTVERRQAVDGFEGADRRVDARRVGADRRVADRQGDPNPVRGLFEKVVQPLVRLVTPIEGRSALDALKEADAILRGAEKSTETDQNATVVRDPSHVNDSGDVSETSKRAKAAAAQVEANAKLEAAYLARLPADQRAQYEAVKDALLNPATPRGAEAPPPGDPVAALALQTMLFRGQLPGAEDLKGSGTTLDNLEALVTAPLAAGVKRNELLSDLVQELATPSSIAQRGKGTCAATSVELYLIHENPAEYVRLVAGLASPRGTVELANGDTLRRELGTRTDDGSNRSVPQRLLAPALMEVGNGDWNYDNNDDQHELEGEPKGSGLTSSQVDRLLEAVMGEDFAYSSGLDSDEEKTAAVDLMAEQTAKGEWVLAGLTWGDGGHKVVVTGVTDDTVSYINPWGREETMPREEFEERLNNVNYDPDA